MRPSIELLSFSLLSLAILNHWLNCPRADEGKLRIETISAHLILKLNLSLANFKDMCLLINIVNFILLSFVKLGYFDSCPGGWVGGDGWEKSRIMTNSAQLKLKLGLSLAIMRKMHRKQVFKKSIFHVLLNIYSMSAKS